MIYSKGLWTITYFPYAAGAFAYPDLHNTVTRSGLRECPGSAMAQLWPRPFKIQGPDRRRHRLQLRAVGRAVGPLRPGRGLGVMTNQHRDWPTGRHPGHTLP